jgi:hypothetical protein
MVEMQSQVSMSRAFDTIVDWNMALAVWWSVTWRAGVFGVLGGAILGFIGGFIAGASGHREYGVIAGMVGGYIATIPASMFAVKQALGKHLGALRTI